MLVFQGVVPFGRDEPSTQFGTPQIRVYLSNKHNLVVIYDLFKLSRAWAHIKILRLSASEGDAMKRKTPFTTL